MSYWHVDNECVKKIGLTPSHTTNFKAWSDRQTDFFTEGKRTKHAESGYPVIKYMYISSDARHITTVHQTGVFVRFVRRKVLNMLKTSNRTKRTSPDIAGQGADSPDKKRT